MTRIKRYKQSEGVVPTRPTTSPDLVRTLRSAKPIKRMYLGIHIGVLVTNVEYAVKQHVKTNGVTKESIRVDVLGVHHEPLSILWRVLVVLLCRNANC